MPFHLDNKKLYQKNTLKKKLIFRAIRMGKIDVVKMLLQKGANISTRVNYVNEDQRYEPSETPLMVAVINEQFDIAKLLLENGANPNDKDRLNRTSLHVASVSYNDDETIVEIAKLLLSHGVNISARANYLGDKPGDAPALTVLMTAASWGNNELVKLLLENGANVNDKDRFDRTALHLAAQHAYIKVIKLLVENGANISLKAMRDGNNTVDKFTPLMFAVESGGSDRYEAVKFLLEKGANPNEETHPEGITALNMAVRGNETKILELLIANGGDISIKKHFDDDPPNTEPSEGLLSIATINGNKQIAEFLIKNGANPNERDRLNRTPLLMAVNMNEEEIAKLLIWQGANVSAESNYPEDEPGEMPSRTPLIMATRNGNYKMVKLLLENVADVNYKDEENRTALHYAAKLGKASIVDLLLKNDADICAMAEDNHHTPLMVATSFGNVDVVKLLLAHGANPFENNSLGHSAMDVANESDQKEIVEIFSEWKRT